MTARAPLNEARRVRVEPFGAIFQLSRPRALVFVDRERARSLGVRGAAMWRGKQPDGIGDAVLSAPLEAHLQLTNRCDVGCVGCYTGATPTGSNAEWGFEEWRQAIDELANMGVFHLALGGGESATLPWLGALAAHARQRGMVPNLTTSGLSGLDNVIANADLFGQINVSIDGLGRTYARVRGPDAFAQADEALRRLREAKRSVGINVVVTRRNFAQLPALFAYARKRRLSEIELLRFKPSGRGKAAMDELHCTSEQHESFLPVITAAARRYRVRVRVDCSYTPMIAFHDPGPELLSRLAVYGCSAGDFLIGAKSTGLTTGCSFAPPDPQRFKLDSLRDRWSKDTTFGEFRRWRDADEPCRSCAYHSLCRGGCRVVSLHTNGTLSSPDPECPRVRRYNGEKPQRPRRHLPLV